VKKIIVTGGRSRVTREQARTLTALLQWSNGNNFLIILFVCSEKEKAEKYKKKIICSGLLTLDELDLAISCPSQACPELATTEEPKFRGKKNISLVRGCQLWTRRTNTWQKKYVRSGFGINLREVDFRINYFLRVFFEKSPFLNYRLAIVGHERVWPHQILVLHIRDVLNFLVTSSVNFSLTLFKMMDPFKDSFSCNTTSI